VKVFLLASYLCSGLLVPCVVSSQY